MMIDPLSTFALVAAGEAGLMTSSWSGVAAGFAGLAGAATSKVPRSTTDSPPPEGGPTGAVAAPAAESAPGATGVPAGGPGFAAGRLSTLMFAEVPAGPFWEATLGAALGGAAAAGTATSAATAQAHSSLARTRAETPLQHDSPLNKNASPSPGLTHDPPRHFRRNRLGQQGIYTAGKRFSQAPDSKRKFNGKRKDVINPLCVRLGPIRRD